MYTESLYQIVKHHITNHYKETFQTTEVDYNIINSRYNVEIFDDFYIINFIFDERFVSSMPLFAVNMFSGTIHNLIMQ